MTTAIQIVNGAAEEIGVKTAEMPLEASDAQVILDRMNDMLMEWADEGLTPEFDEVTSLTDTVYVDRSAVAAIKFNLALRIAPTFQRPTGQDLFNLARESKQRLEASTDYIGSVALPDTLPTGSGNDCGYLYDDRFFSQNDKENF